jgi:uncharacterized membrane protein YhaH (DUF805 family)
VNNYFGAMLRYFEFNGRSTRSEYWWFCFAMVVLAVAAAAIDMQLGYLRHEADFGPAAVFVLVTHFIPSISLMVRRLHDAGLSGWWYWVALIPLIGGMWLFYLVGIRGPSDDAEAWGPDPRFEGAMAGASPGRGRAARQQPLSRAELMMRQMDERRRRLS